MVKKVVWTLFLLIELDSLLPSSQYAKIKVVKGCIGIKKIKTKS